MISFKPLTPDNRSGLINEIAEAALGADLELASDNLNMLYEDFADSDCAVAQAHGCLLARIYEGEYCFIYPLPLSDSADSLLAVEEIRAYAVKEEIPLVLSDVPREEIGGLLTFFRHINLDAADGDNEFFTLRIMSEAALLDEMPIEEGDHGIVLTPLAPEDDEIYSRLSKDEDTNRYWGYDYSADESNPTDSYFRENAEAEFARGVAVSLAVRVNSAFAGEAILYAFDLKGGCECAVRLLPAFRHKGYATEALSLLKALAGRMGLIYLSATVSKQNKASLRLCEKSMPVFNDDGKNVKFKCEV